MNKKGFTLAEVVITLGIIGVVTAITAPSLTQLMPDKNKAKVLKCYKVITETTTNLIDDPGFYASLSGCRGLGCTSKPFRPIKNEDMSLYTGAMKYPRLLCQMLYNDGCSVGSNQVSFSTPDGINWVVTSGNKITIDVNGSESPNCSYNASSCKKPDRYIFNVSNLGYVTGGDTKTTEFLSDPFKIQKN